MLRVLILASLCFSLGYTACPSDYTELYGYCYRVYTSNKNFVMAERQCVIEGGHLASIHDDPTDNALSARIPKAQVALLGLQCTAINGTHANCAWSDGTPYDFDGFNGGDLFRMFRSKINSSGLPIMAYGQCVTISQNDGNWYSTACGAQQNSFICKQPTRSTALTCGDYTPYNNDCIQVKTEVTDFSNAEFNCQRDGGHLLSLHNYYNSVTVQSLLIAVVPNVIGVFFGLYYSGSNYVYTDGSQYDFVNFAKYYPNEGLGYCVQIIVQSNAGLERQWSNVNCDSRMPYVCVRPKFALLPTTLRTTTALPSTTVPVTYAPYTCPSVQLFNDYGTIYSPGFPVSFPANSNCEYLLAGPTGSMVSVRFPYFNTDSGSVLRIYDGISATIPIYTLSGTPAYRSYNSTGNVLKLVFQTSNVPRGIGWQAEFNYFEPIVFTTPRPHPTTTLRTTTRGLSSNCPRPYPYIGTPITSSNYPSPYDANSNCNVYIQYKFGKVKLVFNTIDTVKDVDVLTIYDGGSTADPILGTVSGHHGWQEIIFYSTGSWLTINFNVRSNVVTGGGWYAQSFPSQ